MSQKSSVEIPRWVRERLPPNPRAAVDYLRLRIDEGQLREIAAADYGRDLEDHLRALRPLWSGSELGDLDSWFPMEVLELIRWSEPEDRDWKPGSTGLRGRQMRAFCSAVLLATPNHEPNRETLVQLLESVLAMGREAVEAAGRFLTARIDSLGRDDDRPFFALGTAVVLRALEPEMALEDEERLADWILEEEAFERGYLASFHPKYTSAPWLFGLSFSGLRDDKWKGLIEGIRQSGGDRPLGRMLSGKIVDA
jgi:hypothetical protein